MGNERVLWKRGLYFLSFCNLSMFEGFGFFPHQHVQFWKLEKKGGGRAKDVNCTNVTHIVASGRHDPVTFSYQWDMETGPAWQRSGMNWPGISSSDFNCLFPQTESWG